MPPESRKTAASDASHKPMYIVIADTLIGNIAAGKYPVGESLPTERELCESFQISRHTARESLRQLEQKGLITRRQGAGSTVISRTPKVKYEQNIQTIDDLLQHGNTSRLEVLSTDEIASNTDQFSKEITLLTGKTCISVGAIRYARNDVRPLALVQVYAAAQTKAQARRLLDTDTAAREIVTMIDVSRIGRIEQSLSAVKLDSNQASTLQVKAGDAALRTLRHYFNTSGKLMVVANSLYRGDLYTYMSTLHRG